MLPASLSHLEKSYFEASLHQAAVKLLVSFLEWTDNFFSKASSAPFLSSQNPGTMACWGPPSIWVVQWFDIVLDFPDSIEFGT